MNSYIRSYIVLFTSIFLGIGTGFSNQKILMATAETVSMLFINYLSMIAAPIVLLAILSTLISIGRFEQVKSIAKKVIAYTLLTTTLASLVALGCFLIFNPLSAVQSKAALSQEINQHSYLHFLIEIVPSNIFKAFLENKVISIVFLGFLFGTSAHFLPEEQRNMLHKVFSAFFQLFLKIAEIVNYVMPIAVWAFTALFIKEIEEQSAKVNELWIYLGTVVLANLIQGVVVIPLVLKARGLSSLRIAKRGINALLMAFFTKSSNATLPITLKIAKEHLGIRPKITHFALPLCTVINMNGCAAFILTTVLFVAGMHGHTFSPLDLAFWVIMSVLAAVGNAGVPMGCFFLSSAFLVNMGVPLTTMGLILPFYALIDMEETALNVWSDLSVTSIVDLEYGEVLELQE